jgi:hypothetical protein
VLQQVSVPPGAHASDWSSPLQRYGDLLLLTTEDGTMSRLDPTTDTEWSVMGTYAGGIRTIMPTLLGQHVIFMDAKGYACAFDLASARLLWAINIAAEHQTRDRLPAASLAAGAIVIGTGQGGRLIMMDIDGQRLTARRIGKHILTDMTSPEAGRIVIGTSSALIGCHIV